MMFHQMLSDEQRQRLNQLDRKLKEERLPKKKRLSKPRAKPKKNEEKLSRRDLKDLMSARSYYRGSGGALKQR